MTQNQDSSFPSPERIERAKQFGAIFKRRDLTGASAQEVGQVALDYTRAKFSILSGTPQVVVARPVTTAELSQLGFGSINFMGQEPPLMLVVLKGNFDVSNMQLRSHAGAKRRTQVKYIAYGFDVRAGIPALTTTALYGEKLRQDLKDSTLPDIPKAAGLDGYQPPENIPAIVETPRVQNVPYGSALPPLEENSSPVFPQEPRPSTGQ